MKNLFLVLVACIALFSCKKEVDINRDEIKWDDTYLQTRGFSLLNDTAENVYKTVNVEDTILNLQEALIVPEGIENVEFFVNYFIYDRNGKVQLVNQKIMTASEFRIANFPNIPPGPFYSISITAECYDLDKNRYRGKNSLIFIDPTVYTPPIK